jgi:hypothetical protein
MEKMGDIAVFRREMCALRSFWIEPVLALEFLEPFLDFVVPLGQEQG